MRGTMVYLVMLTIVSSISVVESLDCFSCHNEHNISDCRTGIPCSQDEHCYSEVTGVGNNAVFNLGCRTIQECWATAANTTTSPMASIVGRNVRDGVISCKQCCSQDYCNHKLCSHSIDVITGTDEQCKDNSDFNCDLISSAFNVCNNLHQAKTYCRKWCGLCNFTDGGWSDWTPWSNCDVTCSSGHRLRSRSCTNPKPSVGGLDCVGNTTELSECKLDKCPVHGNWTAWSSWSVCSVSCGVGLERRDRSCSLPTPGPNGHQCIGDAHENRVCMLKSCADGHWSAWSSWSTCTATCNGGLKVKHRSCNTPAPSLLGKYCEGSSTEYTTCNSQDCPRPVVFFAVNTPNGTLINGRPYYSVIVGNEGGGYNQSTAIFTCPISGLYHFTLTIFVPGPTPDTYCYLYHNNVRVSIAEILSDKDFESITASVYVKLNKGDTFNINYCQGWNKVHHGQTNMFTGALIQQT